MDSTLSKNTIQQLLLAYCFVCSGIVRKGIFSAQNILNITAAEIMSNTQTPPSPVDPSTVVGPRARALTASINQAGIKASEADRATKTLTVDNVASTPVMPDVC